MTQDNIQQVDTVVVGGGIAGLAAAAYIAREGRSVVVLERSSFIGGRGITEDRNGYLFNLGPHALYRTGAASSVLDELGVEFSGDEPPQSGQGFRDGKLYMLPGSVLTMIQSDLFSLSEKMEFGRMFASLNFIDTDKLNNVSVNEWIAEKVGRPRVQDTVRALVRLTTYTNDPDRMSAGVAIKQIQMALKGGVLYLDGGWQTLVEGLANAVTTSGGRIETSAVVNALEDRGATKVVRSEAASYEASSVVIATPPKAAADLLGAAGADIAAIAEACGPVRAATLDVGLSATPRPETRFALGIDQPLYFAFHSDVGKLAPEGGLTLHVAKYLGDANTDAKDVEHELEALLELVQPGWQDVVAEKRFLPNLIVDNILPTAERNGLAGRPESKTSIDGVYLAGDWVGPEGWLVDASFASARVAGQAALQAPAAKREPAAVNA